ncbi:MAG: hypothetical protein M3Y54_01175 [Bacteroidota bacterium]|nr:hypothetical protein [Bacteroidota bacterium]
MRFCLLLAIIAGAFIFPSYAQTQLPTPDYPQFYGGISCMLGNYEVTYPKIGSYDETVFSPGLTVGYQFASRAAVQVSIAKSQDALSIDRFMPLPDGSTYRFQHYQENHQNFAVPIILRLNGTRKPERRLQFDALAGFVITHASYSRAFEGFNEQQQPISYSEQIEQTTNVALSIGGGIRYRFGRHFEAVGDANLNRTLSSAAGSGFVNVYTLGLRYRFGYR